MKGLLKGLALDSNFTAVLRQKFLCAERNQENFPNGLVYIYESNQTLFPDTEAKNKVLDGRNHRSISI